MTAKKNTTEKLDPTRAARKRRQEYEERLAGHSSVKALRARARPQPRKPLKRGVPKLIAEAMQDDELADAITSIRRMNRYEQAVDDLARKRLNEEDVPLESEIKLIRQASGVENGLHRAVRTMARLARLDPATEAYAAAGANIPIPDEMLADLPAHLTQSERAAMRYVGWGPKHAIWQEMSRNTRNRKKRRLAPSEITELLWSLEHEEDRGDYQRAPRHLVEEGILTLGGSQSDPALIALLFYLIFILGQAYLTPWFCRIIPAPALGC